ncbi:hypothetical protein BV98_001305 [Sphingobium herbicidovorans NBRC 16415]|uniref:Cytochrome C oxidase subunit IV n=1 Tax=Sphingobium herbicidovorans (strain ATCC 700291 / DSM 11019 / CCUG 56400 / KCTC 2939 / LMG 18315 / NBRC 16415 / MH) TaxID=1219045 RepID=A0A086PC20_SPHHM|nr:cytochrome C oxidase subunit IV family protein [Sphingobium herbicidovorans]KFG90938.1 hypothetical protein BV98_001305 [Sphingobium herbicidovorans NBRC 16415]
MISFSGRPVLIWVILVAATLLSYLTWINPAILNPSIAGSIVMLMAMAKAWLIGMHFMELRAAVRPLRLAYSVWVLVVGVVLLVMLDVS